MDSWLKFYNALVVIYAVWVLVWIQERKWESKNERINKRKYKIWYFMEDESDLSLFDTKK